jgi:hypothetical protein
MAGATTWAPTSSGSRYRLADDAPASTATTELNSVATPAAGAASAASLLHPSNPLMIFFAIAAVTLGLAAFSTSVRVGPAKAAISLGK